MEGRRGGGRGEGRKEGRKERLSCGDKRLDLHYLSSLPLFPLLPSPLPLLLHTYVSGWLLLLPGGGGSGRRGGGSVGTERSGDVIVCDRRKREGEIV